ncbi:MAG: hypothetical protein JW780_07300 [Clostridiales bacterium]|nr:hypothetical protein [Clostridiales bacterium]
MKRNPILNLNVHRKIDKDVDLHKIVDLLSLVLALTAMGSIVYYITGPARGFFHTDCTDSVYWAYASVESGLPISHDFVYAAILPFGSNLWFVPLVRVLGLTYTAHIAGMVIFAVLFFSALVFLSSRLQLQGAWRSLFFTSMIILLSGSDKLREIMWGHVIYYSLSILFVLVGLALIIDYYSGKHKWKPLIFLAILTAGVATDNAQLIALYLIPLLGAIWLERFFDADAQWSDTLTRKTKILTVTMIGMTIVGLGALFVMKNFGRIRADHANLFSTYFDSEKWPENASRVIPHLLSLFGISVPAGTAYTSAISAVNFIGIVCLLIIMIVPFALFSVYRKIENRSLKIILWVHALTSFILVFLAITGVVGIYNWRLTPMIGTAVLSTVFGLKWLYDERESMAKKEEADRSHFHSGGTGKLLSFSSVRKRFVTVCVGILIVHICFTIGFIGRMPWNYGRDNDLHRNLAFLEAHRLEYGFATFWNSEAITLLSDSEIRVRCIEIFDNEVQYRAYQNDERWFENQPGIERYFLLLTADEYERVELVPSWEQLVEEVMETETGDYVIVFSQNPWQYKE